MEFHEINKAKHYNSHPSGVECIDVAQHHNFNIGSVLKYIWRCGLKDTETPIKDLKKAEYYIKREIARLEMLNKTNIENEINNTIKEVKAVIKEGKELVELERKNKLLH